MKLYHADEEDPSRGISERPPVRTVSQFDREVETSDRDLTFTLHI